MGWGFLRREVCGRLLARVEVWLCAACCGLVAGPVLAQSGVPTATYPVGVIQEEFVDPAEGGRPLDYMLIYPAAPDNAAAPFKVFLSSNLHLYKDAPLLADGLKRPLIVFSHGAGGNASTYAWFGEYLASHGYIVAMLYHYRANTFELERPVCPQQAVAAAPRYRSGHHAPA